MVYDAPALQQLAQACAPEIAGEAILPLIQVESGGDPLRININHGPRVRAASVPKGAALVHRYVAQGYSVDVGLAQINSRNFARLGLTTETAFEPCVNLRAASKMLRKGYARAGQVYDGLAAISATYSLYNTGTMARGFRNGYVDRIWRAASLLAARGELPSEHEAGANEADQDQAAAAQAPAATNRARHAETEWVFGETQAGAVVVFK